MRATVEFPVYVTGVAKQKQRMSTRTDAFDLEGLNPPIGARTVIPFQLEDIRDFGDASVDDAIGRGIEVFGKEIGQERRDCRADLRWFEQGWASGGHGAGKWQQAENNRVVPRSLTHVSHK